MAEKLSGGNNGVALIANTLATVWALYVLITILGPMSGAHFNPVVSQALSHLSSGRLTGSLHPPHSQTLPRPLGE